MRSTHHAEEEKVQRIVVQHTLPGAALAPSAAVMWRARVAETGRVFEVPVFETTSYHEFISILMVLPGVPSSPNEIMYLVGPPPYRLLTSKKYMSIVQSEERGNVFLYNVSSQRVMLSPSAEPMDRSNKTIEYILTTSIRIVDKARQNMLEQEVQVSAINSLVVYAASSLESFYRSYFGPVAEKLDLYRSQIATFDQLLVVLADTHLHPAITELDTQRLAEGLASTGGSFGGVSRGSVNADATSPPGSRTGTPSKGDEGSSAVPVLDTPGEGASAEPSGGAAAAAVRRPKATLLDCINVDSWRAKRDLFEKSCHEIQGRLDAILAQYKSIAETVPTPFVLRNVHMNVTSLFRTTALLRAITALPTPLMARAAPPTGVTYAEPSPMATTGPDLTAAQALSEIMRQSERAPLPYLPSSPDGGPVELTASPPSASAVAAVSKLLVATMPPVGSAGDASAGGESADSDPRDAVSIYVVMERTLQKQLKDASQLGELPRDLLRGSIFLKDLPRGDSIDCSVPAEAKSIGGGQGIEEDRAAAVAVMAESLQRRRYRMDQMSKALDFFKERVADEVVRISRIVRDLKVRLKQIEKSESINFLKMWREGQNKHSATLTFLQNYPSAYETFLREVTRIRRFNIEVKSKLEELSHLQNNEMQSRKVFWENTLRFLPPFFLDIVPSVRRQPPLLVGPAGIPGFDDLLAVLPDFDKGSQESSGDSSGESHDVNASSTDGASAVEVGNNSQDVPDIVVPVAEDDATPDAVDSSVSAASDNEGSKPSAYVDETEAEIRIKMLEDKLAEKEREVELLKLELKDSVMHENGLRELQNMVEPVNIEVLKRHLADRVTTAKSMSDQVDVGQPVGDDAAAPDVPQVEHICARIIEGFEMDERSWLDKMHELLNSNLYFKNSSDFEVDSTATDLESMRVKHERALEMTLEQFSKVVQRQARIINNEKK